MRHVYLVCYDIADPARWRAIFRIIKGYGDAVQLWVFRCALAPEAHAAMVAELIHHINQLEDKVLIADLGPVDTRAEQAITLLGKPVVDILRGPIIM